MEERLKITRTGTALDVAEVGPRSAEELQAAAQGAWRECLVFTGLFVFAETIILILSAIWLKYDEPDMELYPYFRDVSIMIFFGFGFLMTFLRRYGYGAIGYCLLLSALVVQWSILLQLFVEEFAEHGGAFDQRRSVDNFVLLNGLFNAGAVMISFGAVLGKTSPTQLLIMALFEPIAFWANIWIIVYKLDVVDIGGGMTIHTLGCYFGLAVCWFMTNKDTTKHPDNCSCYSSDIFSLAGTLFLWIMWPSFNAALGADDLEKTRAVVNTFLCLTGSTISSFLVSRLVHGGIFDPVHIQNSTLAGGVMMGVAAGLNLYPATAIGCGLLVGTVSVIGYKYLTPFFNHTIKVQDVCGIHNLHGMPGVLGSLVAVFALIPLATDAPEAFKRGSSQAAFNLAGLGVTLAIALIGGIITGAAMWGASFFAKIFKEDYYNDRLYWNCPSDYEHVVRDG